ncbi:MAG: 2-amino-4-hydroxy-6-hydroxymethyldihydropteridine diphosphokinase [Lentisphaeria bacterium]|nr:2-amino-4-hydroxy-6-hydroxymethyldihydropteridine diphosphokinase [Lentisphaeria bacterium]
MNSSKATVPVALGLGANLGDPAATFATARRLLVAGGLQQERLAAIIRTAPVDCVPGTPDFCNSALVGDWPGTARELLVLCQDIERQCGRPARHSQRESRLLDLDILLFGELCIAEPDLVVPHPRLRARYFALAPLAELAGSWRIPPDLISVADALAALPAT